MDEYLRYGLLVVAGLILFFILVESWWRRRRFKEAEMKLNDPYLESPKITSPTPPTLPAEKHFLGHNSPSQTEPPSLGVTSPMLNENYARSSTAAQNMSATRSSSTTSQQEKPFTSSSSKTKSTSNLTTQDYLAVSVFAKHDANFQSYDLLQAISATGLQFGEMNIFHFYQTINGKREVLFSLASATKPGIFNLDQMGDFSCTGLTLFLDLRAVSQPKLAFDKMLATAEQLADDLEGELRAGPKTPWSDEIQQTYQQIIQQFCGEFQLV